MTWDPAALVVAVLFSVAAGFGLGRYVKPRALVWWACAIGFVVGIVLIAVGEDVGAMTLLVGSPITAVVAVFSPARSLPRL